METFATFIFWASLYLAITGLVHFFLVRKTATPGQNRWFILSGLVASLSMAAIALIPVQNPVATLSAGTISLPEIVIGASEGLEHSRQELILAISTRTILIYVAFSASLLFLFRILGSIIYLLMRIRLNRILYKDGCKVIPVKGSISPFSFFQYVFVPAAMLDHKTLHAVLIHEIGHIRKKHSLDLLFIELLTVIFWFHPAIWYLRRAIKHQHEYEADRYVIDQNIDKVYYQQLLLKVAFSDLHIPITTPFNYLPLKKRIMMMNKNFRRNHAKAILSMLLLVPFFALVLLLQSCDMREKQVIDEQELIVDKHDDAQKEAAAYEEDVIFTVVDKAPEFPGGVSALMSFLTDNLRYPEAAREAGTQGTVFVSFVIEPDGSVTNTKVLRGIGDGCDEEAVRVVGLMPSWEPGHQRGEAVRTQFNIPVRFLLSEGKDEPAGS